MPVSASKTSAVAPKAARPPAPAPRKPVPRPAKVTGNRAISRMLNPGLTIQAKLVVAPATDRYEVEADRVADHVLRAPVGAPTQPSISRLSSSSLQRKCAQCEQEEKLQRQAADDVPLIHRKCSHCEQEEQLQREAASDTSTIQRKCAKCESELPPSSSPHDQLVQRKCSQCEEEEKLQRSDAGTGHRAASAGPAIERSIQNARGGGHPLPSALRRQFEPRFGADLSSVRLHVDTSAARLAASLGAHAFTTRQDIFFASDRYQPHTREGQHLLAHEITHTIQQGSASRSLPIQRDVDEATLEKEAQEDTAEKSSQNDDLTPEETQSIQAPEAAVDEKKLTTEAKSVQEDQPKGEIVVPNFDVDSDPCPKLWEDTPEKSESSEEKDESSPDISKILASIPIGGGAVGWLAQKTWKELPLSVRVQVVNKAVEFALKGVDKLPVDMMGPLAGWFQAGIKGFLERLSKLPKNERVALFEKSADIILGLNASANQGFVLGVIKGFFVDGLFGIVQMVLDMICFIPRAWKFIDRFVQLLKDLPEQMKAAWEAIKNLVSGIGSAVSGAVKELVTLWKDPKRAIELLKMVYEAGKGKAHEIGEAIADKMVEYSRSPRAFGEKVGRIVGQVAFEAAATYLTAGAEAGISAVKVAAREAAEWVVELGRKFFQIVRKALPLLDEIANLIVRAARFLTQAFKAITDKIYQAIERIIDFFYEILGLCSEGSFKCKRPPSKKPPADKSKCAGRFIPARGGFVPHDSYCARVTHRVQDFRIVLGPVRRCNFDAKVGRTLIECKTGYRWLTMPQIQARPWFGFARLKLREQSLRCLATATSCGYNYVWYVKDPLAAEYLRNYFGGLPAVEHKP